MKLLIIAAFSGTAIGVCATIAGLLSRNRDRWILAAWGNALAASCLWIARNL